MDQPPQLTAALQSVFTDQADRLAREVGVIQRQRVFSGSSLAQTLVFGWMHQPQASDDQLAQMAARCGAPVTERALEKRFTPKLATFLRRLLGLAVGQLVGAAPRAHDLLGKFPMVCLHDSTVVSLPDVLKKQWPGCGGAVGQTAAGLKIQLQWDLVGGAFHELALEPGRQPDQASGLTGGALPAGALRIADLGYFDVTALAALDRQGVYFISRIQAGTAVFELQGRRLRFWDGLEHQDRPIVDQDVLLGSEQRLRCRLVALRCPPEVVRKRRKRMQQEAARQGRSISQDRWASCRWTVLVTNVAPEQVSSRAIWVLAGARWQIELLFKIWKSHNRLDESRSGDPDRILAELYAKLLAIVVQQWVLLSTGWSEVNRSLMKAIAWISRSTYALARLVSRRAWGELKGYLEELRGELSKTARVKPRRKNPSTFQRLRSPDIIACLIT